MGEFNAAAFDEACKEAGLKFSAVARKLNMSDNTLRNKRKGRSEWTRSEMNAAKDVLSLTKSRFEKIFCFISR